MATVTMENLMAAIMQQNSRFDKIEKVFEPIANRLDKMEQTQILFQQVVEQKFDKQEETNMRKMAEIEARINGLAGIEAGSTNEPQGQGSATKRSRSTPTFGSSEGFGGRPAASTSSSASTPSSLQNKRMPKGRVIFTTENHAMVKKEDIVALAERIATDADLDSIPRRIVGGKLAKTFSINFDTKDEVLNLQYAKQFVASRFKNGQWAEARVRGPDDAAGAAGIKIFINVDKEAVQRRGDYAWRSLRRSIAAMRENVTGDARERTVAVGYIGVARVRFESSSELFHLSWLPHAEKAFTEAERRKLEREFDAGGPSGTSWG